MKRQAVIISNPGELGAENYCKGVLKDVENYRTFLLSTVGGAWRASEIVEMNRPSVLGLKLKMAALYAFEYVLFVFSGHGWYSTTLDSTVLELRKGQEIDSAELRLAGTKETIILDCCRVKHEGMPEVRKRAFDEMLAKAETRFNRHECRRYYNKRIDECGDGLITMYSCGSNQTASDDAQKGGVYSSALLEACKDWAAASPVDTSSSYDILSVVQAHNVAEGIVARRGNRQTPHIEKPRTAPYYPLCVVA